MTVKVYFKPHNFHKHIDICVKCNNIYYLKSQVSNVNLLYLLYVKNFVDPDRLDEFKWVGPTVINFLYIVFLFLLNDDINIARYHFG